jgi:hypothetical protein
MRTTLKFLAVTSAVLAAGASGPAIATYHSGGIQVLQPRLPSGAVFRAWELDIGTGAVTGLWKPGIRRGLWDAERRLERGG